ncbi:MAG: transglycosylase SLT domain-containing protein [Bdellovibrionota bacterium]
MHKFQFILLFVVSCQSSQSFKIGSEQLSKPELDSTSAPSEDKDDEIDRQDAFTSESTEVVDDHDEHCKDDIYTKYLVSEYKKQNKAKRYKNRRMQARYLRNRESEALHYAASRIKGQAIDQMGTFPLLSNQRVEFWLRYFKTVGKQTFLKWIVRGESVKHIIEPILNAEGVPAELFYLAMVESGFNHKAYSSARATGTWQFMKGTAKLYGLKIDYWLDERRDPAKSTIAAARFLKDLYRRFGDWHLALAAYNAGPGKVARAIRKSGSNNFWKLAEGKYLSKETKNYVPKLIAAVIISKNPELHGFNLNADPNNKLPMTFIPVDRPVRLEDISEKLDLSLSKLISWNPELIRGITPPERIWKGTAGYQLRLPEKYLSLFTEIEPQLDYIEIKDVLIHKIETGDTLYGISKKYKVSVNKILQVNPKLSPKRLRVGKQVAIPIPAIISKKKSMS